jgi:glutathione synthase/RimK-type ligase-like ATP-grasp enzyme
MILVAGIMADGMIELMCARLRHLDYDYLFLDELRFPGDFQATWSLCGNRVSGYIEGPNVRINLDDITGIYARYVNYRGGEKKSDVNPREGEMITAEYQGMLMSLFDAMPCVVVNRVKASTSNDSKLYQQSLVSSFGFLTPRTLVTTSPDEAEAFYEACDKKVIYKSISSVRSIVKRLDDTDLPRLQSVRNCPTQFQEWIEGVDIRVHTVGDDVFATEMVSEANDYRYAARSGASLTAQAIDIPPHIADACVAMAKSAGLAVSGIDLRRTPDNNYCCFEMNPSPGFLFYERVTGQPISEAVARMLRNS